MLSPRFFVLLAGFFLAIPGANGFVTPRPSKLLASIAKANVAQVVPLNAVSKSASNEESRKFRRTSYTFEDWPKHRSPDRFEIGLKTIVKSRIFFGLLKPVGYISAIATIVVGWNCLGGGYTDFQGIDHGPVYDALPVLTIPMTAFTLTSSSLGLLLGT